MSLTIKFREAAIEQSLARNTVANYAGWHRKFYEFCRVPASQWDGALVRRWMIHLFDLNYSPVSRKQALCAVKFVFDHVLRRDLGHLDLPPTPRIRRTLRTIPNREELGRIFAGLKGQAKLMAALMYGSGLRVSECCQLRVQDIDLAALTVRVWDGKGERCRLTVLPVMLVPALRRHLSWVKSMHDLDLANGAGLVELPGRLSMKYKNANRELRWQWIWPSAVVRGQYRWYATDEMVSKQMRAAVAAAGIMKKITPHTLRHAFATHAMQSGNDIKTVQELLGHQGLNTTAIYLHADAARGVSPMDVLPRQVNAAEPLEFLCR
jgi:site-specific recombinase XerD